MNFALSSTLGLKKQKHNQHQNKSAQAPPTLLHPYNPVILLLFHNEPHTLTASIGIQHVNAW